MSKATSRSMLRAQYTRFCEAWINEKMYQKYLLDKGEKVPEGHNLLTKKPTFNMWMQAVKNKKLAADVSKPPPEAEEKQQTEKQVEVVDKEW